MKRLWTREELIAALKLYCLTPFGRIHARNPASVELAAEIERTPNSVALKLVNFASLDPTIPQKGMMNASNADRAIWKEFFESAGELWEEATPAAGFAEEAETFIDLLPGVDVPTLSTRRIRQEFRKLVVASHEGKCAATGIDSPDLIIASHIIPWSEDKSIRTDPRNGICFNALFDKAFDRGLVSVQDDGRLMYSSRLPPMALKKMRGMAFEKLTLPTRFRPDPAFFAHHRGSIFLQ